MEISLSPIKYVRGYSLTIEHKKGRGCTWPEPIKRAPLLGYLAYANKASSYPVWTWSILTIEQEKDEGVPGLSQSSGPLYWVYLAWAIQVGPYPVQTWSILTIEQ